MISDAILALPHWRRVIEVLLAHPGSTWGEVSDACGVRSPHRRSPEWKRQGWNVTLGKRGRLFVHYATRLTGEDGAGFQGTSVPGPSSDVDVMDARLLSSKRPAFTPTQDGPVLSDEPSDEKLEAEARAVAERMGVKMPSVFREANA